MMYNSGANGPYSLPPGGRISEPYPGNPMHHGPVQPPHGSHQMNHPPSHHFVPIASGPVQSDSFNRPNMMNPPVSTHSYSQRFQLIILDFLFCVLYKMIPAKIFNKINSQFGSKRATCAI